MSYSQPCEANSAVQMTSERKTSQSPALASWRWTNWVRCSSAEAGNSMIFTDRPCDEYLSLNCLPQALVSPVVSLPWQYLISPFAPSIDDTSICLAFSIAFPPPESLLDDPPPSSPPQPTRTASRNAAAAAATVLRRLIETPPRSVCPEPYPAPLTPYRARGASHAPH